MNAVYCISRPERQDRRDLLVPQLERVLPLLGSPTLIWWSEPRREDVFLPASFSDRPGYYAATQAHRLVLEDAWRKNYNEILVLEDDARFEDDFERRFPPFMSDIRANYPDWLALFLGGIIRNEPTPLSDKVVRNNGSTNCHGYVINRHGIWRVLDHLFCNNQLVVDWAFRSLMNTDDGFYSPVNWLIGTTPWPSDNYNLVQNRL